MHRAVRVAAAGAVALAATAGLTAVADDDTGPAITIYNQDFAVVREAVPMNLTAGVNDVTFNDITYHVEPDSVILRDPTGKRALQILEQNYRADPISQELLLSLNEGKTIDFQVGQGPDAKIVQGRIVRSGYAPPPDPNLTNYYNGSYYYQQQQAAARAGSPIIEVNGKLQFTLPGQPLFPALPDDSILKPTLDWTLASNTAGPLTAELAYVTSGLTWKADYNLLAPSSGDQISVVGWVTMTNESGKTFGNARVKLMAGDVNKVPNQTMNYMVAGAVSLDADAVSAPTVTEHAFDDYHLYTLDRRTTLRDRETKQVEFLRADSVRSSTVYVYDGLQIDRNQYNGWSQETIRDQAQYGTQSNPKVWVMREIANTKENGLGVPLPAGRVRFYRRDADGQIEFVGENTIEHTPKDETLRVYTGNAFDLTGSRLRTDYQMQSNHSMLDESFEIHVKNHKTEPATVRVVEHLYRWPNWKITAQSTPFDKKDANTVEFPITIPPDGDQVVTYTVHYSW